jgi:hypothetical protein
MIRRLLASVLGDRRPQIMRHEQVMNDGKNKTTLRFDRRAHRFMDRDDVLVWLSLVGFVALCGATIWVLFWPANYIFG